MVNQRKILYLAAAPRQDVAHLHTRMPFSVATAERLDPFLLLAHHGPQHFPQDNAGLPFDAHPHRGFSTVTFILAGELLHRDSGGHENVIHAGGVQWMTAGAGIVHSELATDDFRRDGGGLEILQLWVNLPARLKMSNPFYLGLERSQIPMVPLPHEAGTLDLVTGDFAGVHGPIESATGLFIATISLVAGKRTILPAPEGRSILFYVIRGALTHHGQTIGSGHLATFATEGEQIEVTASQDTVLLFGHADPIGEPVVARGPFIMNTEDEIAQALADLRQGRFERL